ncbi:DEAD/DEAH box helicase [uncultured Winogradskyella sp.]|uniref:DEAD/DEAH box helicase n=1 Tax=uncultured Winogradskyella sp. TaxID=395353 RepID=UPI0026066957|nr:DEAD/DEAH box helicase [uncultured Winogradskyella sp.]
MSKEMSIETILEEIDKLDEDKYLQDRIAQLNARYILFNTNESKENFPNYSVKDNEMTLLAFQYLNWGCRLAEREQIDLAHNALEKGAQILEYIYGSANNEVDYRKYHVLISSLAYYASFQYSKSFILIKKVEHETTIAGLLSLYLKRNFSDLENTINSILIDDNYINFSNKKDVDQTPDRIYEIVIARALGKIISFLNFGDIILLDKARSELIDLKDIAEISRDVDVWWVIRLILLIAFGIEKSSLWSVLRNHYTDLPHLAERFVYSHVFSKSTKIHEFFTTQRQALNKVINNDSGVIISMPTSSGKTRIAELSILNCKVDDPKSKILFIAPYRSLAFEIENDISKIFNPIGISVSQLYGGSLFSKIDEKLIQETDVIIATQEKAKALLRSDSEMLNLIKLVVIDEGHLLGATERMTRNELFVEELRFHIEKNGGKFVVLSAVLPNPKDLSNWLTSSEDNIFQSDWRPSEERLGTLQWTGKSVSLNWLSADDERDSFNNRFVVSKLQPRKRLERVDKYIPGNKNEAVAATALKLFSFGSVLVFVGRKKSVFTMARAYVKVLGETEDYVWKNNQNWTAFELACKEFDGKDSLWIAYARKGILCHNSDLPSDVRVPLERLMRTEKPRVIIATSTLGQGVNLGVSSVIFSTYYQAGNPLEYGDFWNIAGRAGRAFVDQEGKILVALDASKSGTIKERKRITYKQKEILKYFEKSNIQNAESGLMYLIRSLKYTAARFEGISFEKFLELIAENNFEELEEKEYFIQRLDIIDDTLLSLHQLSKSNDDLLDVTWVEDFFRKSLAYIQLEKNQDDTALKSEELISFIKARVKGVIASVGGDESQWSTHIKSGIPLQSDLLLEEKLPDIIHLIEAYFDCGEYDIEQKINLLASIEELINEIPVLADSILNNDRLVEIRRLWLSGESMAKIKPIVNSQRIINEHYLFRLPWVLNGIAKKLSNIELDDYSDVLQELAILSETGLPNLIAVKIYQAGIRSRESAIELSSAFDDDLWDKSIKFYKQEIIRNADVYKIVFSDTTASWIDLFLQYNKSEIKIINYIEPFEFNDERLSGVTILIPKRISGDEYLVSPDLKTMIPVGDIKDLYANEIIGLDGIYFQANATGLWELVVVNPNVHLNLEDYEF